MFFIASLVHKSAVKSKQTNKKLLVFWIVFCWGKIEVE